MEEGNSDYLIPCLFATVIIMAILILWLVLYNTPNEEEFGDTVTKIMENVAGVPTIVISEKAPKKNILQKILGNVNTSKISFKITQDMSLDYKIDVPSYSDYNFAGKGLVIAASGTRYRYLTGLYTNLYVIRKFHKSNIPVEIFYVGSSEEFSPIIKNMILELGNIRIFNLMDRLDTTSSEIDLRGYQTKPLSVLCSSFEEIILMDADALCFVDPQYFFLCEGYDKFGMVLFKDYVDCLSFISQDFIETIGIGTEKYCNYTNDYEIDSSCVILNKEKCWDALFTICIINVKSDSYHKSRNVLGDKDTWLIGSMFVGISPFISRPEPCILITDEQKQIVGHLQSSIIIDSTDSNEVILYYNNQKVDMLTAEVDDWTYAEVKNPRSGEENNLGTPLSRKIIDCFAQAKIAMKKLTPFIPKLLKLSMTSINGVSNGLIP